MSRSAQFLILYQQRLDELEEEMPDEREWVREDMAVEYANQIIADELADAADYRRDSRRGL